MSSNTPIGSHPTPRIFVSHSHEDSAFCLKLVADLRARLGDDAVWYDTSGGQHRLHGGEAWWDQIIAEITERPYFLVVLSPYATASNWVAQEMAIAFRQHVELGKRLLPVRLADSPRRIDWAGIQEFNFADPRSYDEALAEFLSALNVDPRQQAASTVTSLPSASPQQALHARLAQEAHTAYGRERWSITLDKTNLLIARDAMTSALWRERASAALALGDGVAALDGVNHALQVEPDDMETLRLKGRILLRQGQVEQAAQALTDANTLAPLDDAATSLPLLADLCEALERLNRWDELLRRCGDALYLAPQDLAWLRRRCGALVKLNRNDEALTTAQAIVTHPEATAGDILALARLLKQANAPVDIIRATLDAATAHAPDAVTAQQIAQERPDLLAPPPSPLSPQRFPAQLAALGFTSHTRAGVEWIVPPLLPVPAGEFRLGSDKRRDNQAHGNELNRRVVMFGAFQIARFPVTVAEYACFLSATQRRPPQSGIFNDLKWEQQLQRLDHPVVAVTWYDAFDYAAWLAERMGQPWRLPTEAEWEKAARSDPRDPLGASSERIYPWGDSFESARCNSRENNMPMTAPIGWYGPDDPDPRSGRMSGASPCGAEGMSGNVWEWTATEYTSEYSRSEASSSRDASGARCLRGGAWRDLARDERAAYRNKDRIDLVSVSVGFRLVVAAPGASAGG